MKCPPPKNAHVVERTKQLIDQHPHFRGRGHLFEFVFTDGVLMISGRVPTFYLKQLLQHAVQRVQGVRQVNCRVDVYPSV